MKKSTGWWSLSHQWQQKSTSAHRRRVYCTILSAWWAVSSDISCLHTVAVLFSNICKRWCRLHFSSVFGISGCDLTNKLVDQSKLLNTNHYSLSAYSPCHNDTSHYSVMHHFSSHTHFGHSHLQFKKIASLRFHFSSFYFLVVCAHIITTVY